MRSSDDGEVVINPGLIGLGMAVYQPQLDATTTERPLVPQASSINMLVRLQIQFLIDYRMRHAGDASRS